MKRYWLPLMLLPSLLYGQSFDAAAGGSETYNAYGLKTDYKWGGVIGWSGLGYSNGPQVGGYAQIQLDKRQLSPGEIARGNYLGIGDQMLPGFIDTDEHDTHAFTVRGVGLVRKTTTSVLETFSGFLSQEINLPYMRISNVSSGQLKQTPLAACGASLDS
jgi:hypothetical protein